MPSKPQYGFNMLWMFSNWGQQPEEPDLRQLDFIAGEGFDFIRVPTDYTFWTDNFQYDKPNERVFELIDRYLQACRERGLHMSLNSHRTPGYCINGNDREKDNLWSSKAAQDAFCALWTRFAARYKGVPASALSFDLLNEPPAPGQYGFSREIHEQIMRRVIGEIHAIDPDRPVVLDGICGGGIAIPELADVGATHSGRGYEPFAISHHKANWCGIDQDKWPEPVYPGETFGKYWDRKALAMYYEPWDEVAKKGVKIHIGEFGCHNKTPNDVALRWLNDLTGVLADYGWGWSLWNFKGSFGVVEHGRPGAVYTEYKGFNVDMDLLNILKNNRIK